MLRKRETIQELMTQDQFELIARVFQNYVKIRNQNFEINKLISKNDKMKSTVNAMAFRRDEAEKKFKNLKAGISNILLRIEAIIDVRHRDIAQQYADYNPVYSDYNQYNQSPEIPEIPEEMQILQDLHRKIEEVINAT